MFDECVLGVGANVFTTNELKGKGKWPANHAHGSIPGCRGHLANYRASEGREKKRLNILSLCISMWCVQ